MSNLASSDFFGSRSVAPCSETALEIEETQHASELIHACREPANPSGRQGGSYIVGQAGR